MHDLIELSIEAHGGLEQWNQLRRICATASIGGIALKQRGQEAFTQTPTRVTVDTRKQKTIFAPFLAPGQRGIYEPRRIAVETLAGSPLEVLQNPRDSFKNQTSPPLWSAAQLTYFVGYAMWMYFTLPFSLLEPGIECEETRPWEEEGEMWRTLKVAFPASYVSHSTQQTLYFDKRGLIRRLDYNVDIANGGPAAHYIDDYQKVDGMVFPAHRRIYPRGPDLKPQKDILLISADFSDIEFARTAP